MQEILPGIWKGTFGSPEVITPVGVRPYQPDEQGLKRLGVGNPPSFLAAISGKLTKRGYEVTVPLQTDESLFGLGLQLLSINRTNCKRTLRVNSDPTADLGDSHAPVPFYVSTAGYAVYIDTARYATFYLGSTTKAAGQARSVTVEVPIAQGVDVYIFAGPTMVDAVRRYVLFSGAGCLPPRWGLGVWYRPNSNFSQKELLELADDLRTQEMPCDVLGPEPGWQTHAYSCSFAWSHRYPSPGEMVQKLANQHFRVNLWTHIFTHPTSPIHEQLEPYSADYTVWEGLVPDLLHPEARRILADYHEQEHVELGISGYKLDECDNSDFNRGQWSFPELASFPSGADGEQMHSLIGVQYQHTIENIFRKKGTRTYGLVRSSGALAAPLPYVLYSDLYDHASYIKGMVSSGFSGLLWTPEIRHATSAADLVRRLQTVILSPMAIINTWYIKHPPWKQWQRDLNSAGQFLPNWEELQQQCRDVLKLRMQLVPYIYASFARYHQNGTPPFRALALDYPTDRKTWNIGDQYMVGDRLMVAPMLAEVSERKVYLPEGQWFDFWTGLEIPGGQTITISPALNEIPMFVSGQNGAVLALAKPTLHTDDPSSFELVLRIYGEGERALELYEDDGLSFAYEQGSYNWVRLVWHPHRQQAVLERTKDAEYPTYRIVGYECPSR